MASKKERHKPGCNPKMTSDTTTTRAICDVIDEGPSSSSWDYPASKGEEFERALDAEEEGKGGVHVT